MLIYIKHYQPVECRCKSKCYESFRRVNRSTVQGSGLGPTLFISSISDLRLVGLANSLTKCAEDVSLLVPEKTDVEMSEEFSNLIKWTADNKLTVNLAKMKEIVFHWPNPRNYLPPAELD